ncbi:MAG: hypothetical protein P8L46_00705, partial [Acidimicrobiales bacterium]|nr:hypothetical protein [Acidimicrobiales bacterium]
SPEPQSKEAVIDAEILSWDRHRAVLLNQSLVEHIGVVNLVGETAQALWVPETRTRPLIRANTDRS